MLNQDNKKVALIGTGSVEMSYAYALLNQNLCNELVLVDENVGRAQGQALDLSRGLPFSSGNMKIYAGNYNDCKDADIAVLSLGSQYTYFYQEMGKKIRIAVQELLNAHFSGIFLIASDPVDLNARIVYEVSHFPASKIIGLGTMLDTANLRYMLGQMFCVDPKNVHACVMGAHGDSEFVAWSQAMIATKSVFSICREDETCQLNRLLEVEEEVRQSEHWISERKGETCYGMGMALARVTKAIFGDENAVLTVSTLLNGNYGEKKVFISVPCIINRDGVKDILELPITEQEREQFSISCNILRDMYEELSSI